MTDATATSARTFIVDRLRAVIESGRFQTFIIAVIIVNAAVIGLETSRSAMAAAGGLLFAFDLAALAIFILEISVKLFVYRLSFFRDPWNIFDFAIIAVALVPAGEGLSVLRALRILRALRLISVVPQMRLVVQALLTAIPALGSVVALLALIFYVAAVIATKLFGADFPEWFGSVGPALYTLFQIMTLESWSMGIVRPVMEVFPYAWAFFVPFILLMTFAVLNLFIAVVVNAMSNAAAAEALIGEPRPDLTASENSSVEVAAREDRRDLQIILEELRQLRTEIHSLKASQSKR